MGSKFDQDPIIDLISDFPPAPVCIFLHNFLCLEEFLSNRLESRVPVHKEFLHSINSRSAQEILRKCKRFPAICNLIRCRPRTNSPR
ncbi:hypothetical protein JHK82_048480 [Glycine max]|nr:hypothetical protein JHK82_048480 [Glycine max]